MLPVIFIVAFISHSSNWITLLINRYEIYHVMKSLCLPEGHFVSILFARGVRRPQRTKSDHLK